MEQFIFNIIISFLVGIPSGIVASHIFEKIKNHSRSTKTKSDLKLEIIFKLRLFK